MKYSESSNESVTDEFDGGSIFPSSMESMLPNAKDIYQKLRNGVHITSLGEGGASLYRELQKKEASYQHLFTLLGYELVHDSSGFFYFNNTEERGAALLSATKKAALVIYTLFSYLEDQNIDPAYALREQPIAWASFVAAQTYHQDLYRDAEIADVNALRKSINWLKDKGFCLEEGDNIRFLSPVERFLRSVENWSGSDKSPDDMEVEA